MQAVNSLQKAFERCSIIYNRIKFKHHTCQDVQQNCSNEKFIALFHKYILSWCLQYPCIIKYRNTYNKYNNISSIHDFYNSYVICNAIFKCGNLIWYICRNVIVDCISKDGKLMNQPLTLAFWSCFNVRLY